MTEYHGFELVDERDIPELNSRARLFRHIRTGAELLSMENDDDNKVFGITFKTPPEDDTGLPHILEHSVLCGSRKYPVKEPLIEIVKGSLQTFINAMTFPDKTMYPVASTNLQDFYNMVDVYMDAVFYPLITQKTFEQEGWHFELFDKEDPLSIKGVVFNEMKGYYSSPDIMMGQLVNKHLFPDTPYAVSSGGDPAVMPDLTYEQFKTFHDTYYHPSNSRIFFYGDDDPEERLRMVDAFIQDFDRLEIDAEIPLQTPFDEPRRVREVFEADPEDDNTKKSRMALSWLLNETTDVEQTFALQMLSHILVGTPASPLRKALIDSGLGEDLVGGGTDTQQRQVVFSTGLKGIKSEDAGKVEDLILETLKTLAEDGIDPATVEASMNTVEFQLRENNTGPYPRGLFLNFAALTTWLHGGDPMARLAFEGPLENLKQQIENDNRYFETMIRENLLDNPARTTLVLEPDTTVREKRDAAEQKRIDDARAAMTDAEIERLIASNEELKRIQETPDSPEALATIPSLNLDDLEKEATPIPLEEIPEQGATILYHDIFTNGITYVDLAFDLHVLPQQYLPYVTLFGRALLEMGTETEDFVQLSQRIGRKTGGIEPGNFTSQIVNSTDSTAWFTLRSKVMADESEALLDILSDVLLTVKLDNQQRFLQMVLEEKAQREAMFGLAGHLPALHRVRAHFGESFWAKEQIEGASYLFFLRELAERVQNDWSGVLADLRNMHRLLINRNALVVNVTVDGENWSKFQSQVSGFLSALPGVDAGRQVWKGEALPQNEAFTTPTQVHYVSKAANLYDLGYTLNGSNVVIFKYLNTTYMWERIRIQGGAYGGAAIFDHPSGVMTFLSWQDPNFYGTLSNYDGAAAFLREVDLSQEELTKSIIGAIGEVDQYMLPDAKGYASMARYLIHYTDEQRQQVREQILSTTMDDFKKLADALEKIGEAGHVVVTASPDAIKQANAERDNWLTVTKLV